MGTLYDRWPKDMGPENSPVYTCDVLEMSAEPKIVWAWLIRAEWWPKWYRYWSEVKVLSGPGPNLEVETVFTVKSGHPD